MTRDEIKMAVEFYKKDYHHFDFEEYKKHEEVLVQLAEGVLRLPEETKNPHEGHSTRGEDGEFGWCDTCQASFEGSTLFDRGRNSYRSEAMKALNIEESKK